VWIAATGLAYRRPGVTRNHDHDRHVPGTMLSTSRIAASDDTSRHLLLLHGIYGRGRNWQAIAKAVTDARPAYACWLIDLPHHGDSGPGTHGDTVQGLAADLDDWVAAEGLTPDAILGHSFGGKVALAFAQRRREQPLQVWAIDSTPDTGEPSGSAWNMLRAVRGLPDRFASRDEVIDGLVKAGYAAPVAQWMATNLAREGDEFVWRLDFDAMEGLLRDFYRTDLWSVVEDPDPKHDLHFLKASESTVISPASVSRLRAAPPDRVHLHERKGSHWIHAESPDVVTQLLAEHLP
jgi:esterase